MRIYGIDLTSRRTRPTPTIRPACGFADPGLRGRTVSAGGICEIQGRFGEVLPNELLWVKTPGDSEWMQGIPGAHGLLCRSIPKLLRTRDRHYRRVVAALIERGVIVSERTRAPLRLTFSAKLASRWMPGLFLEQR